MSWSSLLRQPPGTNESHANVIEINQVRQRVLQECLDSAVLSHLELHGSGTSKLPGKGDFKLCGVVKPLVFFYHSHLELLVRCHLFIRKSPRNNDIVHTFSVISW